MPRRPRRIPAAETPGTAIAVTPLPANAVLILAPEQSPTGAVLKNLLSKNRTAQEAINEIKDSLGGIMTDATQNRHLDKTAWGWLKKLDKMSPEKMHDTVSSFLWYFQASGLKSRADAAQRLPLEGQTTEAEAAPDDNTARVGRGTVTPFPQQTAAGNA